MNHGPIDATSWALPALWQSEFKFLLHVIRYLDEDEGDGITEVTIKAIVVFGEFTIV